MAYAISRQKLTPRLEAVRCGGKEMMSTSKAAWPRTAHARKSSPSSQERQRPAALADEVKNSQERH